MIKRFKNTHNPYYKLKCTVRCKTPHKAVYSTDLTYSYIERLLNLLYIILP